MFVAQRLVYLEMQKTGGTHIGRLLERYADGRTDGKHNRLTADYAGRFVIGSIRNPWDWYISLWAYGVSGKGAVRNRTVSGVDFNYYHRMLPKEMGKNWLTPGELFVSVYHDAIKPVANWRRTYENTEDPKLFRAWLRMLLDYQRRFDINEGWGFSPLCRHSGLMTYRYFRLFTLGDQIFRDRRLRNYEGISAFDRECNLSHGMIKTESLEEDFIRILAESGSSLSEDQKEEIRNKNAGKTNVSERKPAVYYYDDETIALVAERERYLIEKYDYLAPA